MKLSESFIAYLVSVAKIELPADTTENFNPTDVAEGSFYNAYYSGEEAGNVNMAREVLIALGVDYD